MEQLALTFVNTVQPIPPAMAGKRRPHGAGRFALAGSRWAIRAGRFALGDSRWAIRAGRAALIFLHL
jgi:hypothetical protein